MLDIKPKDRESNTIIYTLTDTELLAYNVRKRQLGFFFDIFFVSQIKEPARQSPHSKRRLVNPRQLLPSYTSKR